MEPEGSEKVDLPVSKKGIRDVGPKHDEGPMGQVDDIHDPPNERKSIPMRT